MFACLGPFHDAGFTYQCIDFNFVPAVAIADKRDWAGFDNAFVEFKTWSRCERKYLAAGSEPHDPSIARSHTIIRKCNRGRDDISGSIKDYASGQILDLIDVLHVG